MATHRMAGIPGFGIDRVAALVGDDPEVLRLENLDTDLRPSDAALAATKAAVDRQDANSWLPFTGKLALKESVARHFTSRSGIEIDAESQVTITCGEGDAMLDALMIATDPGDEVILTDPTYAGMLQRVRMANAIPRLAPLVPVDGEWRLDLDRLRASVSDKTRAIFVASPALPTGWVADAKEWETIASLCRERDLLLINLGWMESILYDGRLLLHPGRLDGMAERLIQIGCVSFEQRMIGWRIGWMVSPLALADDAARAHIYNGLTPGGVCQFGALAALETSDDGIARSTAEWERRRNAMLAQLDGLPVVRPAGGWSMIMEAASPSELSLALAAHKVAATPMTAWGETVAPRYIRFIFSREPVERIALLRERLDAAMHRLG
jgi:aspartate/methionine/tyrosine aminotransferase